MSGGNDEVVRVDGCTLVKACAFDFPDIPLCIARSSLRRA
jgi:hypothetical protein